MLPLLLPQRLGVRLRSMHNVGELGLRDVSLVRRDLLALLFHRRITRSVFKLELRLDWMVSRRRAAFLIGEIRSCI